MSQINRACPAPIAPSANAAPVAGSGAGTAAPEGPIRSSSFSAAVTRHPASPAEMLSTCRSSAAVDRRPTSRGQPAVVDLGDQPQRRRRQPSYRGLQHLLQVQQLRIPAPPQPGPGQPIDRGGQAADRIPHRELTGTANH